MVRHFVLISLSLLGVAAYLFAQPPMQPGGGRGGPGGPGGPGGAFGPPGGPGQPQRNFLTDYDKDGDGRLNAAERMAAREAIKKERVEGGGGRGFGPRMPGGPGGPRGFGRGPEEPPKPGIKLSPDDVKPVGTASLYDANTLRTLFFEFENKTDWEAELEDFYRSDVDVPATLIVDGKRYPNVGVHFRGMSSFFTVGAGRKRSLNVALDFVDEKQRLLGAKTLNLLNMHEDDSCMSTVLYSHIACQYLPVPKANFVRVVVNGENWGVYCNVEQFNKDFTKEHYQSSNGIRWKVSGSPMGGGGLEYIGTSLDDYRRRYEIKTADNEKSWKKLIQFCKVLNQTPSDKLEDALRPLVDLDELLWFLALDNALINCDGYWIRASDYSIYCSEKGMFHFLPHDMNEAFRQPMGPGMGGPPGGRGGPGGPGGPPPGGGGPPGGGFGPFGFGGPGIGSTKGVELDPLVGLTDPRKPLRSKVLAVPSLQAKYLANVKTIAQKSLDWNTLGPVVAKYRAVIEKELEIDTRKLGSIGSFRRMTADDATEGRGREMTLRAFADQRRKYLLDYSPNKEASK